MKYLLSLLLFLAPGISVLAQSRPKVGLTLSGGGAKGLSHIGILKAIDSAGLKIDVVTGTSMGSIMGALYAVGYSGKQIEQIARGLDWGNMFSNRPPLELINTNEKKEFANYAVEVPIEKGKARLYSGFIEAEEIWLRFGELFYPVHDIKDFSKFSIPFRCIATDAATGKPVVLSNGEIVKAVRASMAIPSVFTSVPYNDTKLVDGGVVRNFPVLDAKEMGADYVIGVNLSNGLLSADKLITPIDILYQMGFYKDADDFNEEVKKCDLLIKPDLEGFSAASFGSADSIISVGNETGKKYYPYFKRLADSLNALYPGTKFREERLPRSENTILSAIEMSGLQYTDPTDFMGKLGLKIDATYSGKEFSDAVRKAYSWGNFRRIAYYVDPVSPGHSNLKCEVIENPKTHLKIGIHYHTYTDIALITTMSTRNLLLNRSKSYVKINWSSNFRALARHDQAFGKEQRWGALFSVYHERFRFPLYANFLPQTDYQSIYSSIDLKFYKLMKTTTMSGFGISREWLYLKPKLNTTENFIGHNGYWNVYFFLQRNSLDLKSFPRKGSYIDLQAGVVFGQNNNFIYNSGTGSISSDSLNIKFTSYEQLKFKVGKYVPLRSKLTFITQFSTGINFNYQQAFLNFYSVGGINDFIRNQIPFVGLSENQVNTNSISAFLVGLQYEPLPNLLATFRANAGIYDYINTPIRDWTKNNFLSGYAISGGYRSLIGPIEISLMYSDQTRSFLGYVNMGFTF